MRSDVILMIIDPQYDFCNPKGSLYVPGADEDMNRVAEMVRKHPNEIDDIQITMDTHQSIDIAHPSFWIDPDGNHPAPFTQITYADIKDGKWAARAKGPRSEDPTWELEYTRKLEESGRYPLIIWPEHCLDGSLGWTIHEPLRLAIKESWEIPRVATVQYIRKGQSAFTEHYSALMAEVPIPLDLGTLLDSRLIEKMQKADTILLAGEALSHCVANTVRDLANNFGEENISNLVLLKDATSSVTGFENRGDDFINEMTGRGMRIESTTTIF